MLQLLYSVILFFILCVVNGITTDVTEEQKIFTKAVHCH